MVRRRRAWMWIALAAAMLMTAMNLPAMAQTVQDVPPNHWAYEAVTDLVRRGYLTVEDGRFRGDQPVDRFTLATVVARILHEIETGGVLPQSEQDVKLLESLVTEYREEMVRAFADIERNRAQTGENQREILVVKDKMNEVIQFVDALERALREGLAEQEAKHQAELHAQALQLQSSLNELRQLLADDRQALRAEVAALAESLRSEAGRLRRDMEDRVALLEANVREALAESGIALGGLEESLRADAARLQALEREVSALSSDFDAVLGRMEEALREIQSQLNAHSEALATQRLALDQQQAALGEQRRLTSELGSADASLLAGIEAAVDRLNALQGRVENLEAVSAELAGVSSSLDQMKARIDGVERQVLAMQSQIGLSEEQLRALGERLMQQLDSDLQLSLLRASTLEQDLKSLREEFNSYRQATERELQAARSSQMFGIIGAVLGLIGLAN